MEFVRRIRHGYVRCWAFCSFPLGCDTACYTLLYFTILYHSYHVVPYFNHGTSLFKLRWIFHHFNLERSSFCSTDWLIDWFTSVLRPRGLISRYRKNGNHVVVLALVYIYIPICNSHFRLKIIVFLRLSISSQCADIVVVVVSVFVFIFILAFILVSILV